MDFLSNMTALPSTQLYLSILQECTKNKTFYLIKQVFEHLKKHGITVSGLLADYLVLGLAKCGELEDAREISQTLPSMSLYSWSALISGYVECGNGQEAMCIYHKMQENDVEPSKYTLITMFKVCSIIQDVDNGKIFHAFACMKGFCAYDVFVGCALVSMYGKCGFAIDAESVFCEMPGRDIVSWNAMMSAYLENQHIEKVLQLYSQMYDLNVNPNEVTFLMTLQACGNLMNEENLVGIDQETKNIALEIGKALHFCLYKHGFLTSILINNTLISMYGKVGAVHEAEALFDELPHRDVISWNSMLSAYVANGEGKKALTLYVMMERDGLAIDILTLVLALKACGVLVFEEKGSISHEYSIEMICVDIVQAIHTTICIMGFCVDPIINNTLVGIYSTCGAIVESEVLFLSLSRQDSVAWNKMLSAYVMHGHEGKALLLYRQMQEEGVITDAHTLVYALQASANLVGKEDVDVKSNSEQKNESEIGKALHAYARRKGFTSTNVFVVNTIIGMYGKCGAIAEAEIVFSALWQPDVVSYNAMLSSYVNKQQGEMALQLFRDMQENGIAPTELTFVIILQACAILTLKEDLLCQQKREEMSVALEIGKALHIDAERKGFMSDIVVGSSVMNMYAKCGGILETKNLFGIFSNSSIVPWNTILSAYIRDGQPEEALTLLRKAQKQHAIFDDLTLTSILQACSLTGKLDICKEIHFGIASSCYREMSSLATTLIYAYGSCGGVVEMQACFEELPFIADIVLWNAFIDGYVGEGSVVESMHMFERLQMAGMKPDEVTLTSILSICNHEGLIDRAIVLFESMGRNYNIIPNSKHYGAMVDLLGRVGDFKRLENMLEKMPMEADTSMLLCLLGACCTHGNISFAEWAFRHSVMVDPQQVSAYIFMSNTYANVRSWES